MITIVKLDSIDTILAGNYSPGDVVLVLCDAINEPFTVNMPDAGSARRTEFVFIKTDSSVNAVTLSGIVDQDINGASTFVLKSDFQSVRVISDGLKFYIAADSFGDKVILPSFTVANLPTPTAGALIFVTDETAGAVPAFGDGTNFLRVTDRAIVS